VSKQEYSSLSQLARRLGVRLSSIRRWISLGLIEAPSIDPTTQARGFSATTVLSVERWYLLRCLSRRTRGPKARERREWAKARVFQ